MKKNSLQKLEHILLSITICSLLVVSCKSDPIEPKQLPPAPIKNASYQWGELSINRKNINDEIKYNKKGYIDSLLTTDDKGFLTVITFNYQGNKIFLNTAFNDSYELDERGRVVLHTSSEVQQGMNYVNTQKYSYDNNGYLNKVELAVNNTVHSVITYEVENGNYLTFRLSNTDNGQVTRQYQFTYNRTKVISKFSIYTALFANNTSSAIEKYLNFGKQSINQLTSIDYNLINLNGDLKSGKFSVKSHIDGKDNVIKIELIGNKIDGFPSDNLSPLPRMVNFVLNR